ncbi:MAG TPA: hypothetical protein VES59_08525 [Bacteroidota bacterium]|nr:hypothetical protein [Bacteroidota bacterium]
MEQCSPELLEVMKQGFDDFFTGYTEAGIIYPPLEDDVKQGVRKILQKMELIPHTHVDAVYDELCHGLRWNETLNELRQRIARVIHDDESVPSSQIAQTISNFCINYQNIKAARESMMFSRKSWVTMRDGDVRDLHASLDGVEVPMNEKFILSNGDELDYPGDPDAILESMYGCRCTVFASK